MQNESLVKVSNISHAFLEEEGKPVETLVNVSFEVEREKFICIVGPSGCGKSTLLRIILGLMPPTKGKIIRNFTKSAVVFQGFAIFPWLTVYKNVEFGLKMKGVNPKERKKIAEEKIQEVGLAQFGDKYPKELSGGMRQRVSIARALAMEPEILLMDEPFSNLDAITADKLKKDILVLWNKYKMTVFMVTHLIGEAVELSDKIIVLSRRPGSVKSVVDVALPRPRNTRSPDFYRLVDNITANIEQ